MSRAQPPADDRRGAGLVLVDGSNVRRSTWPNPSEQQLVDALDRWSAGAAEGEDVLVYFDRHPSVEGTSRVEVRSVGYADDHLVDAAREAAAAGRGVRVATSDRELRQRVEQVGASVAWGGGRFLDELGLA